MKEKREKRKEKDQKRRDGKAKTSCTEDKGISESGCWERRMEPVGRRAEKESDEEKPSVNFQSSLTGPASLTVVLCTSYPPNKLSSTDSRLPNQMVSLILIFGFLCRSSIFRYPDDREI